MSSAPEANYGIRGAIEEARHGHFDMGAYDDYLAGKLDDRHYDEELLEESLSKLTDVD